MIKKNQEITFRVFVMRKKIQNNEIKTPTLEDTIFKKKKRRLLKSGNEKMQQTAAQEELG